MKEKIYKSYNLKIIYNFFSQFKPIHFTKGGTIYRPGLPCNSVFLIEKGFVKTLTISESGEEKIIMFYKQGDIFPLSQLFQNSSKEVFAEAISDVVVKSTNEDNFNKFLQSSLEATKEFLDYTLVFIHYFSQRVENLSYMTAYPRLVFFLLTLIERFESYFKKNKTTIEIPIYQKEIANTIAMTRETVSRELEKLKKDKLVSYTDHKIIINNVEKLEKELEDFSEVGWR